VLGGKLLLQVRIGTSPFSQHSCSEEVRFEISALSLVLFHAADDATPARKARLSWMPSYHNV
jgi:hypothetical protein